MRDDLNQSAIEPIGYRLSPWQLGLWRRLEVDGPRSCIQAVIRVRGAVDAQRLERALVQAWSRHEILRTSFQHPAGCDEPVQIVHNLPPPRILRQDLQALSEGAQRERIDALLSDADDEPLDVRSGPLVRCHNLVLSESEQALLMIISPLCADLESVAILMREIADCYAVEGGTNALGDPPQFADVAEWQRELVETDKIDGGTDFWHDQACGPIEVPEFPCQMEPPDGEGLVQLRSLSSSLPPAIWKHVQRLADQSSPQAWLFACWSALIARLTRASSFKVHCYSGNRPLDELTKAVGPLGRHLPLRFAPDLGTTIRQHAAELQILLGQVGQWQYSFGGDADGPGEIGLDYFPLPPERCCGEVSFSLHRLSARVGRFKLRLSCIAAPGDLNCVLHYDSARISDDEALRLIQRFQAIVRESVERPEAALKELNILSDDERQSLLIDFNNTLTEYPKGVCVQQFFERHAELTPEKTALAFKDRRLSYGELNRRANQLARHLQSQGVGPNVMVGICLERSLEMVVGILGVLKAGGAYVPLDPAYPGERIGFMLEDTAAPVIVAEQKVLDRLPEHRAQVVLLDRDAGPIDRQSSENLEPAARPEDLVYVIYTSGSTGKPKGVMITHEGLVISNTARINYFRQPVEKFLLLSSFSFDSSVVGIFWTLCTGGCLVLIPEEIQKTPAEIARVVAEEQVTHLLTLPSFYSLILEQAPPGALDRLQTAIVAGEPCPKRMVDRHRQLLPRTQLFSEYGATETTVFNSVYDCLRQTLDTAPIGRPIDNAEIYLLDENFQPVPIGVAGEAFFGGAALSPGYLNRPELNAEKFIIHPFRMESGARLYRSGDLLRHLPCGDVEFLGRLDNQVKIRGFRIELEEIEAVLLRHENVREAVVLAVAPEDWNEKLSNQAAAPLESGGKRLAAYVATVDGRTSIAADLRAFLAGELPDYMVPSAFIVLGGLPKHPNGKFNRRALPAPGEALAKSDSQVAPRTATEQALMEVWCQVLRLKQVGVHDNFFELGGDSILSIQVVARVNQAGLAVTPMQLFQHQTIAELAKHVGGSRKISDEQGDVVGDVLLTPIQHWFCQRRSPNPSHWNMPLLLELQREVCRADLEQAAQALLRHHDSLRLRMRAEGSGWKQQIDPPGEASVVEWFDLSHLSPSDQQVCFEAEASRCQTSLSLEDGPLMRLAVFDFGAVRKPHLLWVLHHLTGDIVSWRILLEDLETALEQLARSQSIQLPPKTSSFRQYAKRLQQYAHTEKVGQEKAYWLAEPRWLAEPIPVDLPDRSANTEQSLRLLQVGLTAEETDRLLHGVPKAYQTQINDVLLTALLLSFAQWTGRSTLLVEVESHGREDELLGDVDLSRTVGWFTTYFPVLLKMDGELDIEETLRSVKHQLRAVPERGFHYGLLRYLGSDPDTARRLRELPQAEVNFNYLGRFGQVMQDSAMFKLAPSGLSCGLDRSPGGVRSHQLEVVGWVIDGCLQVDWTYSEFVFHRSTIEVLGRSFVENLRTILDRCRSTATAEPAPVDDEAFGWDQSDLYDIAAAIRRSQGAS